MAYRPLRISELSGTPIGYTYAESDLFHVTCGTVTSGPSLSSVKMSFTDYSAWQVTPANTSVLWVSAGDHTYNTNSGNVAIGLDSAHHIANVASENEKLTVAGSISAMGSLSAAGVDAPNYFASSVGIGTYVPDADLHIKSSSSTEPEVKIENVNDDASSAEFRIQKTTASPAAADEIGQIAFTCSDTSGGVRFASNIRGVIGSVGSSSVDGDLTFSTYVSNTEYERMRILADGKVGIGTTSPSQMLHVQGAPATDAYVRVTAPSYGSANFGMSDSGLRIQTHETVDSSNDADIYFHTDGGGEVMRIKEDGKVGIGTTAPNEKLTVKGNIQIDSLTTGQSTGDIDRIIFSKDHDATPLGAPGMYDLGEIRSFTTNGFAGGLDFYAGKFIGSGNYTSTHVMRVGNADGDIDGMRVGIGTKTPAVSLDINDTDAVALPTGTTAQRPTGANGMIRYNTDLEKFEGFHTNEKAVSTWCSLGGVSDTDQDTYIEAHASDDTDDDIIHFYTGGEEQIRLGNGSLYPEDNNDVDLGIPTTNAWKHIYTYDLTVYDDMTISDDLAVTGDFTVGGSTVLGNHCNDSLSVFATTEFKCTVKHGNDAADTQYFTGHIGSNFIPTTDSTYDLGSADYPAGGAVSPRYWKTGYIDRLYVTNTSRVASLNADRVDSLQANQFATDFGEDGDDTLLIHKDSTGGTAEISRITVPYATMAGSINNYCVDQDLCNASCVRFKCIGVNTDNSTAGTIKAAGDITAFVSSDIKLKENIMCISDPLDKISRIRGVEYDWTDEHIESQGGLDDYFMRKHDVGVIAQELEDVLPEVVATRDNGIKAVRYEKVVPLLIEAIKELSDKVKRLEESR